MERKSKINIINTLIARSDIEGIIAATDDDREGQVIFDEITMYLKMQKPIERLLLNEWTSEEVQRGLQNLKPNSDMQSLQDAGIGRQWADWLIGINLTSVATVKYRDDEKIKVLNIGRVLLPTLKIIYDRDKEIENFQESKYYKLIAEFNTIGSVTFESIYYENDNEKFEQQEYLETIRSKLNGKNAVIIAKKSKVKKNIHHIYLTCLTYRGLSPVNIKTGRQIKY